MTLPSRHSIQKLLNLVQNVPAPSSLKASSSIRSSVKVAKRCSRRILVAHLPLQTAGTQPLKEVLIWVGMSLTNRWNRTCKLIIPSVTLKVKQVCLQPQISYWIRANLTWSRVNSRWKINKQEHQSKRKTSMWLIRDRLCPTFSLIVRRDSKASTVTHFPFIHHKIRMV